MPFLTVYKVIHRDIHCGQTVQNKRSKSDETIDEWLSEANYRLVNRLCGKWGYIVYN